MSVAALAATVQKETLLERQSLTAQVFAVTSRHPQMAVAKASKQSKPWCGKFKKNALNRQSLTTLFWPKGSIAYDRENGKVLSPVPDWVDLPLVTIVWYCFRV
jgi:hypothetical protein